MKTTSLIGRRCKCGNTFSRPVLITRGLDLYSMQTRTLQHSLRPIVQFSGRSPVMDEKWPDGQVVKTGASHAPNGGSTPPRVTTFSSDKCAPLAQLVEHLTLNQGVQGSSP